MTQLETQLKALSDLTGGDLFDSEWNGGEWKKRSAMKRGTIAGMP